MSCCVNPGGTSCVRWTERTGTQEKYATKVFNTLHPEHSKLLSAELRVLLAVDCPCVVKFYGVREWLGGFSASSQEILGLTDPTKQVEVVVQTSGLRFLLRVCFSTRERERETGSTESQDG